jgi:hypothetical protein
MFFGSGQLHRRPGPRDLGRTLRRITSINMALLTEGGPGRLGFYKYGPPDGGRARSSRLL